MSDLETLYIVDRQKWRQWLGQHFQSKNDIWLEYPLKKTGKERIVYNDAVEEALCFGWIDSTVKSLNEETTIQRFCPRRKNSKFSQANKERLRWLLENDLIHQSLIQELKTIVGAPFVFPKDILLHIEADEMAWKHYQNLSASYRRIRIAYIEAARKRPDAFKKRLNNFIEKTRNNQMIKGFGGIEKYY